MSDDIVYWDGNPDPLFAGCRVTGVNERGVEFPGVEPLAGSHMFIGSSVLHRAIGMLYDLQVVDVIRCLGDGTKHQEKRLQKETDRADAAEAELAALRASLKEVVDGETTSA